MSVEDLWDFDGLPIQSTKSPALILKEQAEIFSQKMGNSGVVAEVAKLTVSEFASLVFSLDIVAPALGGYRLRIVRCKFSLSRNFPLNLSSDFGLIADTVGFEVVDEAAFRACLKDIFSDHQLRASIASLVANVGI